MKHQSTLLALVGAALLATACGSHSQLTGVSRTRLLIDSRYDVNPSAQAEQFLAPYRQQVDSLMSPVVGQAATYLSAYQPESPLSNLLPDILVWASARYGEHPDFAVYNIGGIRAAFAQGPVTVGDVLDVAPFENKICFVTLTGSDVLELLGQIAMTGGQGISHGLAITIDHQGHLLSATLHGQPFSTSATYRVATLDYVAQGNDKMEAFKKATQVVSPQDESNNVRYLIMDYFRQQAAAGRAVDAAIEGRITVATP